MAKKYERIFVGQETKELYAKLIEELKSMGKDPTYDSLLQEMGSAYWENVFKMKKEVKK